MRRVSFSVFLFCLLGSFVLAGCSTQWGEEGKPLPKLTFAHYSPVAINVGSVRTQSDESLGFEAFVKSPHSLMKDYMHARFAPQGFGGLLQASVEQAQISHSYEPSDSVVAAYLDLAGRDVYEITMNVRLEHFDEKGQFVRGSALTVGRILKISEHASMVERETKQMESLEALFTDLDQQVQRVVLNDMGLGLDQVEPAPVVYSSPAPDRENMPQSSEGVPQETESAASEAPAQSTLSVEDLLTPAAP